jgi:hypothetical protein
VVPAAMEISPHDEQWMAVMKQYVLLGNAIVTS